MKNLTQMVDVIRSLKMSYGEAFFTSLTMQLHQIIDADYTFIARLNPARNISQTLAFVTDDGPQDNFEYDLAYTPCADVSLNTVCVYASNVCELYPKDQLLIDMGIRGYIGTPLHDSNGKVVGLIVGLFKQPIENAKLVSDIFQLFEGRASAELERSRMVEELRDTNTALEQIVDARTFELQNALKSLEAAQQKMIEQEKQTSLGRLVVGVAHELNTPLGVAILAGTTLSSAVESLSSLSTSKRLTQQKLTSLCEDISQASSIVNYNLSRAAELVVNFKQISVDQINDESTKIELGNWLQTMLKSLEPVAKKHAIELRVHSSPECCDLITYPAKLYHVINNIVMNAITHAFSTKHTKEQNVCLVSYVQSSEESIEIMISDNGVGIGADVLARIYEPFFTTIRGKGGTGLGMSIVYNLVTGPLQGQVSIDSQENIGTQVTLKLPVTLAN